MDECWICECVFGSKKITEGIRHLQTFKGYTVDFRLKQFRKVPFDALPAFIDFDSSEGEKLCGEMHEEAVKQLNKRFGKGKEIFISI
jgi:hypothetical protein